MVQVLFQDEEFIMNECTVHTSCKTSTSVVLKQSVITCLATTCQLLKQQKSWNVWRDWSSETLWILSNLLWTHISSYTKLMISFASPSMLFSTTQTARNKRVSIFCVDYSSAFNTVIQNTTVWSVHNLQHTFFIYYSIVRLSQTNVIFCKSTNTHTKRCSIPF